MRVGADLSSVTTTRGRVTRVLLLDTVVFFIDIFGILFKLLSIHKLVDVGFELIKVLSHHLLVYTSQPWCSQDVQHPMQMSLVAFYSLLETTLYSHVDLALHISEV